MSDDGLQRFKPWYIQPPSPCRKIGPRGNGGEKKGGAFSHTKIILHPR
jgi:hypothetical protein